MSNHASIELAIQEAEKVQRRVAMFPDLVAENLWGEFVATCSEIETKANQLTYSQKQAAIRDLSETFLANLEVPNGRSTPTAILSAEYFLKIARFLES